MIGSLLEGGFALALGAIVYDIFLAVLRRVDRAYPSTDPTESTWWFGYARDVVNLAGLLVFAAAFRILGLPGPQALLAGGMWTMGAYGLDYLLARVVRVGRPDLVFGAILVPLAAACAALRDPMASGLSGLCRSLFR